MTFLSIIKQVCVNFYLFHIQSLTRFSVYLNFNISLSLIVNWQLETENNNEAKKEAEYDNRKLDGLMRNCPCIHLEFQSEILSV